MFNRPNFDDMYESAKKSITTINTQVDNELKGKDLKVPDNMVVQKPLTESFINRQLNRQNRFLKKNAEKNDFFVADFPIEIKKGYTVDTTPFEVEKVDKNLQKRLRTKIIDGSGEFLRQQMLMGFDEKYGVTLPDKITSKSYLVTIGIHNLAKASVKRESFAQGLAGNETYMQNKELFDALAPELVLKEDFKMIDRKNPYGEVEFTEESLAACQQYYEGLEKDMAGTLTDAILVALNKLDTMSPDALSAEAIVQNFYERKLLRDKLGAIHELMNMDSRMEGPIGDVIRKMTGIESSEIEEEIEEEDKEKNKVKKKVKKTVYAKVSDASRFDYYLKVCANMHMALDSDLRTAAEKGGITFKEGTGFLHEVNEKGMLTNLGARGKTLNTYFHVQRKKIGGEASKHFFSAHKNTNLKAEGTLATYEHARYMSMLMDSIYKNVPKDDDQPKDTFGVSQTVNNLIGSSKERYEKNKNMIDNMAGDAKNLALALERVKKEVDYFKNVKTKIDNNEDDPSFSKIKYNPQLKKYLDVHIARKESDLLKLMARTDGYLNAMSNIFLDKELTDAGMDIINQYNEEFSYKDMSKSAVQIRKITEYYSRTSADKQAQIFEKIAKHMGEQLTPEKDAQFKTWMTSADGEFVLNYLGTKGLDVFDMTGKEIFDQLSPYCTILSNAEKATTRDEILDNITQTIEEVNKSFTDSFNEFFGKIENIKFGTASKKDIQEQMDKFINMHLKYDSLTKILNSPYQGVTVEEKLKEQILDANGKEALEEYSKNKLIISKQFTVIEDILLEYRLNEIVKKLEQGTPIELLYDTKGSFSQDSDILGVISLYENQRAHARRKKGMEFKPTIKTFITQIKAYHDLQSKRTMQTIKSFSDVYEGDAKSLEKSNIYQTNIDQFMRRFRKYEAGQELTEQDKIGSEGIAIGNALKGIKFGKKVEKKVEKKDEEIKNEDEVKKEGEIKNDEKLKKLNTIIEDEEEEEELKKLENEIEKNEHEKKDEKKEENEVKNKNIFDDYEDINDDIFDELEKEAKKEVHKTGNKEIDKIVVQVMDVKVDNTILYDKIVNLTKTDKKEEADKYTKLKTYLDQNKQANNALAKLITTDKYQNIVKGFDLSLLYMSEPLARMTRAEKLELKNFFEYNAKLADELNKLDMDAKKKPDSLLKISKSEKLLLEQIALSLDTTNKDVRAEQVAKIKQMVEAHKTTSKLSSGFMTRFNALMNMNTFESESLGKDGYRLRIQYINAIKERAGNDTTIFDKNPELMTKGEAQTKERKVDEHYFEADEEFPEFMEEARQKIAADDAQIKQQKQKERDNKRKQLRQEKEKKQKEEQEKLEKEKIEKEEREKLERENKEKEEKEKKEKEEQEKKKNEEELKKRIDEFEIIEKEDVEKLEKRQKEERAKKLKEQQEKKEKEEKEKQEKLEKERREKEEKNKKKNKKGTKLIDLKQQYGIDIKDPDAKDPNRDEKIFIKNLILLTSAEKYNTDPYWKNFEKKAKKDSWQYIMVHGMLNGKVTYENGDVTNFTFPLTTDLEAAHAAYGALTDEELEFFKLVTADASIFGNSEAVEQKVAEVLATDRFKSFQLKNYAAHIDVHEHGVLRGMIDYLAKNVNTVKDKLKYIAKQKEIDAYIKKVPDYVPKKKGYLGKKFETQENQKKTLNCFATSGAYLLNYWNKHMPERFQKKDNKNKIFTQDDFKDLKNIEVKDEEIKKLLDKKADDALKNADKDTYDKVISYQQEYEAMKKFSNPEVNAQGNLWQLADMYLDNLKNVCVKKLHFQKSEMNNFEQNKENMFEYMKQRLEDIFRANGGSPIVLLRGNASGNNVEAGGGHYVVIKGITADGKITMMDPYYKVGQPITENIPDTELDAESFFSGNTIELQWLEEMKQSNVEDMKANYDLMGANLKVGGINDTKGDLTKENKENSDNLIHNKGLVAKKINKKPNDPIDKLFAELVYIPKQEVNNAKK